MKFKFAAASILLLTAFMSCMGFLVAPYISTPDVPRFVPAFVFGFMTFLIVGGVSYLVYYSRSMSQTNLTEDELADAEIIWAKTQQSMVHYKSGNPYKFWEAVGGRLFLTNQFLEFRSFPAEFWVYRITIPLEDIRRASPVTILGFIRGTLRIERHDGTFELFTFGAAYDLSCEWASAILDFRDDLEERNMIAK